MNSSQKIAKDMNVLLPDSFAERPHYRCSSFAMHFTETVYASNGRDTS